MIEIEVKINSNDAARELSDAIKLSDKSINIAESRGHDGISSLFIIAPLTLASLRYIFLLLKSRNERISKVKIMISDELIEISGLSENEINRIIEKVEKLINHRNK